jgi:7-cyano-7-deazaguanine synthase
MQKKALVLFSGGQDSSTCLAQALHDFPNAVTALCIHYGQRHKIEIEQAKKICDLAQVPLEIIELPFIASLSSNALTNTEIPIQSPSKGLPSTFVEGRNLFFLSVAAVKAKEQQISIIYMGVCETDYSGYPDCREDFIKSAQTTLSLALDYPIQIITPLMHLTKAQTVQLMKTLGKLAWYTDSHSCYEGQRPACGQCPACLLRLKGFKEAGIKDPLEYSVQV